MLNIIFEDENILVVNKPAGLVAHPFDFSSEKTLLDFVFEKYSEIAEIKNEKVLQDKRIINLGGLIHKLDRETSGIILFAKNKKTFDEIKKLFEERKIKKTYVAKVDGIVKEDEFVIDAPLAREKKSYRQVVNPESRRGELREAITNVKVLDPSVGEAGRKDDYTFVELNPVTGRTHQLRAHMKYVGHPILGDKIYGNKNDKHARLMLHAQKLDFILNGEIFKFETEIPKEFI